jgi:hypothetical protein
MMAGARELLYRRMVEKRNRSIWFDRRCSMALEDYLDPEVGVAVAVTAAVLSPRVRGILRRGAVYGLAGVLTAGDAIASFARGAGQGVRQATTSTTNAVQSLAEEARAEQVKRDQPQTEPERTTLGRAGRNKPGAEDVGGQI